MRSQPGSLPQFHLFAVFVLLLAACPILAQVTGVATIQGVVTDNSGAVVVGAKVSVTNPATGVALKTATNEDGLYRMSGFNPGRYNVEVEGSGFAPTRVTEVRLEVGQTLRLDVTLKPGSVTETVEVTAQATLLNSETTDVGQVIDGKRIVEMPLNGRNYLQLAQLTAGVLPAGNSRTSDEGGFLAFGQHTYQNNVLLDGADNSSRASGGPLGFEAQAVKPPVDALSEFKVLTNNTSAEFGYSTGAKVLVTTKGGTNQFHGSLYEFLRNDAFDATNFFANRSGAKKPVFKQNQFGGTVGGPILKNRAFFFFSYQGTRRRIGILPDAREELRDARLRPRVRVDVLVAGLHYPREHATHFVHLLRVRQASRVRATVHRVRAEVRRDHARRHQRHRDPRERLA